MRGDEKNEKDPAGLTQGGGGGEKGSNWGKMTALMSWRSENKGGGSVNGHPWNRKQRGKKNAKKKKNSLPEAT